MEFRAKEGREGGVGRPAGGPARRHLTEVPDLLPRVVRPHQVHRLVARYLLGLRGAAVNITRKVESDLI